MDTYTNLETLWFALIAVLWIGYFVLEGFDFGVGMLLGVVAKDDTDRRVVVNTIGPVWDGNEVWLLTAGGATFAAFPEWYATLFSGFYLPLFLILVALIARGVAFEFRSKDKRPEWRRAWDWAIIVGSFVPALLWGVAFANLMRGVPIEPINGVLQYTGGFWNLLNPYALLGGVMSLTLFLLHGSVYLCLKTTGDVALRARRVAVRVGAVAVAATAGFLLWSLLNALNSDTKGLVPDVVPIAALGAVAAAWWLVTEKLDGWAFAANAVGIALVTATIFLNLYPRVMPSSVNPAFDLTISNAASTTMTLTLMSVVALIFVPIVLLYQGWSYYVFRKRVSRSDFEPIRTPVDLLGAALGGPGTPPVAAAGAGAPAGTVEATAEPEPPGDGTGPR